MACPSIFAIKLVAFWPMGSSWMLLWSLTALAPIILHLWSKRHRRETEWAAMRFLRVALEQHARRMQLEQWLLLLLRVAPLLILGVALADPLAPWLKGAAASSQQVHHVIVIDATYSMGARSGATSAFENAKKAARDLISNARPGDSFTLVRMAQEVEVLMPEPVLDSQEALAEVDRLQLSHGGASLSATASAVEKLLRTLSEKSPHWLHQLVWLSDLTSATWNEVSSSECRSRFSSIKELAAQRLVDVAASGNADYQNLAVTQVTLDTPLVIVNQPLSVDVVVQSFGHVAGSEGVVTLTLNNEEVDVRPLRVPASGSQTVTMQFSVSEPGDHCLDVKLDDDALNIDNQRHYCFRARRRVRTLVVEGRAGAGRMLALAIRPTDDSLNDVEVAAETALVERDLSKYDCVMLANVGRLGDSEARQLTRYVQAGGGLAIFLGDQVQADSYNSLLIDSERYGTPPVLPARIKSPQTSASGLDPLDYRHPIVQVFQGHEQAGLRVTPVYRSFQLEPLEGARRVLDLSGGEPFFLERSVGSGKCLLIATAASPESTFIGPEGETPWSELASWPSFLPLIQQSLLYVVREQTPRHNRLVGDSLIGHFPNTSEAELTTPEGAEHRLAVNNGQWTYDLTMSPGVYTIRPTAAGADTQLRGVNVDIAESDLSKIDASLLPPSLPLQPNKQTLESVSSGARLFRWLLIAVFCFVLMECWFSNRLLVRSRLPHSRI